MSFRTPYLIEVPRDRPTWRMELRAFKEQHGIQTHDDHDPTNPGRWLAVLMEPCRKFGYGVTATSDLFDLICKVGRLMDESGYTAYAKTELQAIRLLCDQNQIPCPL